MTAKRINYTLIQHLLVTSLKITGNFLINLKELDNIHRNQNNINTILKNLN